MPQEYGLGGLGVACSTCDRPLRFIPDCYPLVFRCENAHLFTLEEILDHDLPGACFFKDGLPWSTLRNWEQRARLFHALSGCALRNGHPLIAADFKEAANRFEGWISSLGTLLAKRYPSAAATG
ncbi:MAG TPA: hypothetical protein VMU54_25185 [Planctomycetota bacterium]|nr:hypothetical protein [Planctomycetota bacterium]